MFTRRKILIGSTLLLAGCARDLPPMRIAQEAPLTRMPEPRIITEPSRTYEEAPLAPRVEAIGQEAYGEITSEPFLVPPLPLDKINQRWLRQVVSYPAPYSAGTIVIDPGQHFLFHVMDSSRAMRYGIGVGREGFAWNGQATIRSKQTWPRWFPPPEMRERQPELQQYADGMPGGVGNPLGARAMYLYQGTQDTLYRIHGTSEPLSIGKSVSSGCIRMFNHDVINLYDRVPIGTQVVVLPAAMSQTRPPEDT